MAKKKDVKTTKKKVGLKDRLNPIPMLVSAIRNEKFRTVTGLCFILSASYLLIAFISFLFTWKEDQDLLFGDWGVLLGNPEIEVSNWLGKIGAITSQIFINQSFGISSFLLIVILFLLGVKIWFNISLLPLQKSIKNALFFMVWSSAFLGFFFDTNYLFIGGTTGYYINDWLSSFLGSVGTFIFLVFALIVYSVLVLNFSITSFIQIIAQLIGRMYPSTPVQVQSEADTVNNEIQPEVPVEKTTPFENIDLENIEKEVHNSSSEFFYPEETTGTLSHSTDDQPKYSTSTEPEPKIEQVIDSKPQQEESLDTIDLNTTVSTSSPDVNPTNDAPESPVAALTPEEESDLGMEVAVAESNEEVLSEREVNKLVKEYGEYDPTLDLSKYEFPTLGMLENHGDGEIEVNRDELEANKNNIVQTLSNYKIAIDKISATIGPTVTLYEIVPAPGVRISKIKNLEDDIALSLAALGIRIIAPIPGKGTIGIEVPNQKAGIVSMKAALASDKFQNSDMELPLALGKTISNETFVTDLTKMPHLLMAGATGQGKSVGLNAILVSILYKKHPSQVKFVLVDPKKVELTLFNKIERHFLAKLPDEEEAIITDTSKVVATLNSLCIEMDQRYELLKEAHCRNLKEYNKKFTQRKLNPENGHRFLPYIVVVVDEFADLIMTAGKEVETPIARLAQLARAIGIHLIIATQRPSVNIITGTIKANFPSRIAFRVTAKIDSRTILDAGGADQLIGRGDMLFSNGNDLIRIQCAFVDTPEVEEITDFIGNQQGYPDAFLLPEYVGDAESNSGSIEDIDRDVLFEEAARTVVMHQQGSASLLQRKLKLGYNRAGRIIDQLEAAGIIGPFKGSKAREVLIPDEIALEQLLSNDSSDL